MNATLIKRGDQYLLPIALTNDGDAIALEDVDCIKFVFQPAGGENLVKYYPSVVEWDSTNSVFLFPLTAEETLSFNAGYIFYDVQVKFVNGDIIGLREIGQAVVTEVLDESPVDEGD